ncbi:MAG: 2TM domain-containing protein [Tenacibaculum sp.]
MKGDFLEEKEYLKAKKKVKQIKAFYMHLIVNIFSIIIIVTVNLMFSPHYHWFWFAVMGIVVGQIIHGLAVFGIPGFNLGKDWEEKKIKQILEENGKNR